jgi:G6PDH family F420-dependent oxidoreductase
LKVSYDIGAASDWFEPRYCLDLASKAERAGFYSIWVQDHFLPWYHTHAHCPQAWVWIAAAAERTKKVKLVSGVTAPMFKYHPAVVAHAFATMGAMYPHRIILGVGSGEAMNEAPFIENFPGWKVRFEMLIEAVQLIRQYWSSQDYFSFNGKYFKLKNAFCYDKPATPIPIYFSAYGPKGAFLAGQHGDHLVTWGVDLDYMRKTTFPQFEKGAKQAGKNPSQMEKAIYLDFAYGNHNAVIDKIKQSSASWFLPSNYTEPDPRKIQANVADISAETIEKSVFIAESLDDITEFLERYQKAGVEHVVLSDSSPDPDATISVFEKRVLRNFAW